MTNEGYIKPVTIAANALDHEQMDYIMKHGIKRITILRKGIEEFIKEFPPTIDKIESKENIKK